MTMTPEAALALRQPFPAESIGKLPKPFKSDSPKGKCNECGGFHGLPAVHLDYVGHAATTDRLLTVDPAWNWEPFAVHPQSGLPLLDEKGNLWIRLTVCGVTRIGVGDGRSMKELIGDAIRNAAMRFGVALDLWAKEDLVEFAQAARDHRVGAHAAEPQPATRTMSRRRTSEEPAPESGEAITPAQSKALHAAFGAVGIKDRDARLGYCTNLIGRELATSSDLTKAEASRIIEALKADEADARGES